MYLITDKSSAVKEIQSYLNIISREYGEFPCVVADGIYGSETRECVAGFQEREGLAVTGVVDLITFEALFLKYLSVLKKNAAPKCIVILPDKLDKGVIVKGEESAVVAIIQALLLTLKVIYEEIGDIEITGIFDSATENAVKVLQKIEGIEENGIIDTQTWNAIASAYEKFINADT